MKERFIMRSAGRLLAMVFDRWRPPIEFAAITLLAILVLAIAAPAIRQTRERARQVQARDHLQQLGLSFQNYHATWGCYPTH